MVQAVNSEKLYTDISGGDEIIDRIQGLLVFPVVTYGCESWIIKKGEGLKIDAFELWCWRRLLSVPWTTRRSNQLILKEISLYIHWED